MKDKYDLFEAYKDPLDLLVKRMNRIDMTIKAKCKKCGGIVEVTKNREFKTCECGAIALDYGDGENYYRACGNPEDFDGEIEGS